MEAARVPQEIQRTLSALRHRNYRLYWFGQLSSVLAQSMETIAQSWLVLELTNSPLILGLTGLTHAVPTIALTLLGGVLADRADRRRIMIITQATSAVVFFCLATLVSTGLIRLWHVIVAAFLSGSLKAFDRPSRMALLPQMVPREDMANAVAMGGSIWQLNRLIGPAVAGMLIYLFGIGPTYYMCFVASMTAVGLWLFIRAQHEPLESSRSGLLGHMMEGLNFIRENELFYIFIAMTFFNSVFGMSYLILMPVFARDILLVGSQGYGFLQSAGGGGALCGTLMVAYLAQSGKKVWQAILGAIVFGLLLITFSFSPWYYLSLAMAFLMGWASQFYVTTINTLLQLNVPEQLRGRVMGIYGLTWDLMPAGGAILGTIAEFAGAPIAVALGGFLVSGMALSVALYSPRLRQLKQ